MGFEINNETLLEAFKTLGPDTSTQLGMKPETWHKLFDFKMQVYGPEATRKYVGITDNLVANDPNKLKADDLQAIEQYNSKGFQIIDITPQQLNKPDYACNYSADVLTRLLGPENALNTTGEYFDTSGAPSVTSFTINPYWRTVYLPIQGTFLKIETLPIRQIASNSYASASNYNSATLLESQLWNAQNYLDPAAGAYSSWAVQQMAQNDQILVDFNATTYNPIIAKHGDVIKTYFSGVFVTFKQNNPRIRITIGFNSTIESNDPKPTNLAMWTCPGYINHSQHAPIPFNSIGTMDISNTGLVISELCLIANVATGINSGGFAEPFTSARRFQDGVSLGWITEFSAFPNVSAIAGTELRNYHVILCVKNLGLLAVTPVYTSGSILVRNVASMNCGFYCNATAFQNTVGKWVAIEAARVTLSPNQGLFLRVIPLTGGVNTASTMMISVSGYWVGALWDSVGTGGFSTTTPLTPKTVFSEHPYAAMQDGYELPRR